MRSIYVSFFILEFKKWMGYRIDFWLQLFVSLFVEVGIAYFLWDSVFTAQKVTSIGGFTFEQMLIYYVIASFISKMIRTGDEFLLSREIYEGSITKFLLYPLSTLWIKMIVKFSYAALAYTQLLICIVVLPFFIKGFVIDPLSLVIGTYILVLSVILAFYLNAIVELVSFWADNVWTLIVLMRFAGQFLGGAYLPIPLFPESVQNILMMSPFPYTFYVPIKIFMGDWSIHTLIEAHVFLGIWIVSLGLLARFMWHRGLLKYNGAGQ
jgi:ABC-2 type transport system permease protein